MRGAHVASSDGQPASLGLHRFCETLRHRGETLSQHLRKRGAGAAGFLAAMGDRPTPDRVQVGNLHLREAMHTGRHRSRRFPTCEACSTVMQVGKLHLRGAMQAGRHRSRRFPTCEARSMVMQVKNLHLREAMQAGRPRSRRFPTCDARSTVMQVKKPAPTGSDAGRTAT